MRSVRISCRPGTPFVTPMPSVVPWSGSVHNRLVDEAQAQQYLSAHPEPTLP